MSMSVSSGVCVRLCLSSKCKFHFLVEYGLCSFISVTRMLVSYIHKSMPFTVYIYIYIYIYIYMGNSTKSCSSPGEYSFCSFH